MSEPPKMNVVQFRKPIIKADELDWSAHWAARAQKDPVWAAKQIGGLLERALKAEGQRDAFAEWLAEAIDVGAPIDSTPDMIRAWEGVQEEGGQLVNDWLVEIAEEANAKHSGKR